MTNAKYVATVKFDPYGENGVYMGRAVIFQHEPSIKEVLKIVGLDYLKEQYPNRTIRSILEENGSQNVDEEMQLLFGDEGDFTVFVAKLVEPEIPNVF